ncbi:MAG: NAD(P)-dependent oxidoreductase [Chloroflexi bacterium]|nr:NAD(P)-dependent oxidoreductase [Chloroflexota bacterium]
MRVLITGGAGLVGTPISRRFVQLGWDVRVIGIDPDCDLAGVRYAQCDIRDFDALEAHLNGCDAVVHLAAIPSTRTHPNAELFEINVAGTFNVFEAAARAGIKRIAQASSINAIGGFWGCDDRRYESFPLDEAHPLHTTDAYSYSKQMVEEIAAYYQRRAGINSVSFRLPAVWNDASIAHGKLRENAARQRRQLNEFLQLPEGEQQSRLLDARRRADALRARKPMELDGLRAGIFEREAPQDDWLFDAMFYERFNFWTFIHTDDSTAAFELALTADIEGAHPLFANSDRNWLGLPTETLLRLFFPEVPRRTRKIVGDESPVSIERARELLGFAPQVRDLSHIGV